jgi:hypothetical protein
MDPAPTVVTVEDRFNGPRESGNGGYSGGLFAAPLGSAAAEVSLRSPVPLDAPLLLERESEDLVRAQHGETLIAEARPLPGLELAVPEPVGLEEARAASERYRAPDDGFFSECFVCGRAREDSFGVFAGQVDGRDLVASPWTPPTWTADGEGAVRPEFVWAALDCPTYFASHLSGELTLSMLVRQRTELHAPVAAGEEHVVMAWPIEAEGRKRLAGGAVLSADGEVLATTEILLVEPRS